MDFSTLSCLPCRNHRHLGWSPLQCVPNCFCKPFWRPPAWVSGLVTTVPDFLCCLSLASLVCCSMFLSVTVVPLRLNCPCLCWLRDCVLSSMCPSLVRICPCDAHQWVNVGWRAPSLWIQGQSLHQLPLWPQTTGFTWALCLFLHHEGYTDLPHRGVVRINKCWYSALEMWRCCVNAKK